MLLDAKKPWPSLANSPNEGTSPLSIARSVRPADVGKDQTSYPTATGLGRDGASVEVAPSTTDKSDWAVPPCRLGEHEVRARRPARELQELRRPHHPSKRVAPQDEIAESRMVGVHDTTAQYP